MASELFRSLDALFSKEEVPSRERATMFVLNRFMAWDPALAPYAAALSDLKDDEMAWEVWKAALPKQAKAPRLGYPAPKRTPGAGDLVASVMRSNPTLRAEEADLFVEFAEQAGRIEELAATYGVELKEND